MRKFHSKPTLRINGNKAINNNNPKYFKKNNFNIKKLGYKTMTNFKELTKINENSEENSNQKYQFQNIGYGMIQNSRKIYSSGPGTPHTKNTEKSRYRNIDRTFIKGNKTESFINKVIYKKKMELENEKNSNSRTFKFNKNNDEKFEKNKIIQIKNNNNRIKNIKGIYNTDRKNSSLNLCIELDIINEQNNKIHNDNILVKNKKEDTKEVNHIRKTIDDNRRNKELIINDNKLKKGNRNILKRQHSNILICGIRGGNLKEIQNKLNDIKNSENSDKKNKKIIIIITFK